LQKKCLPSDVKVDLQGAIDTRITVEHVRVLPAGMEVIEAYALPATGSNPTGAESDVPAGNRGETTSFDPKSENPTRQDAPGSTTSESVDPGHHLDGDALGGPCSVQKGGCDARSS
jgi:hypothetical protein